MDPFDSIDLGLDPAAAANAGDSGPPPAPASPRRADIDAKQEQVARILETLGCEGMVLLLSANVGWFTSGLHARGLVADAERPAVYTNGKQRWLLCSNV